MIGNYLAPRIQAHIIVERWPGFRVRRRGRVYVARGKLRPSSLSLPYQVRIDFGQYRDPKVIVEDPEIVPREAGGEIPHTYQEGSGRRPCLYDPRVPEWDHTMSIAGSIIPWTMEWLFFYEIWLATGDWLGGGAAHGEAEVKRDEHV